MTEPIANPALLLDDDFRREQARGRLYVFCQLFGWGSFLALQLAFAFLFQWENARRSSPIATLAPVAMIMALGLLITHYTRPLMTRWGWKQLGWRALVPRVFAMAAVQSFLWSLLGYGYMVGLSLLQHKPVSAKPVSGFMFAFSWVQGVSLLCGWLCIYFFYHLSDRYNRSEVERLRLAGSVKEAELRALKSQVNPHFIFNALNSVRALIDEDPARARQSVTQLANLLRYSLQSAQAETVAFEDELRVVNDYLALEQVRHEERLQLRLDVAPETLRLAVPPLLLQTLVENAVKYGISPRPEGGEIVIEARAEQGQLRLRVTNPGQLATTPTGTVGANGHSTGVGLKNAAERLRLFFGGRASLALRAEPPCLVVAEVSLPAQAPRA